MNVNNMWFYAFLLLFMLDNLMIMLHIVDEYVKGYLAQWLGFMLLISMIYNLLLLYAINLLIRFIALRFWCCNLDWSYAWWLCSLNWRSWCYMYCVNLFWPMKIIMVMISRYEPTYLWYGHYKKKEHWWGAKIVAINSLVMVKRAFVTKNWTSPKVALLKV